MENLFIVLAVISVVLFISAICISFHKPFSKRKQGVIGPGLAIFIYIAALSQFVITGAAYAVLTGHIPSASPGNIQAEADPGSNTVSPDQVTEDRAPSEGTEPLPTEDLRLSFQPVKSSSTDPENFQMTWEIAVGDEIVESYIREDPICFELDKEYFALPGIATFRGNNYRDNATYGTAVIEKETMGIAWSHPIGSLNKWGGCAWTGQPLVVQWDQKTKDIMTTMYESKRNKDGLVEVIYATLDGYIHFYDLEDGSQTRAPINVGLNFKGAGALDPRGYPLLYVGAGLYVNGAAPRMFVVNLITGKIIYEYGVKDSFALRDWSAFDSCPLVDAESDTLIWAGENGLLYTIKLNTEYDMEAGTISINPDEPVKTRYTSWYSEEDDRYLGYEASPVIVDHYLFTSENGGLFQCVDLNTMELVWVQDTKDDSNSSPLFEWDSDGNGYLYTAPSLHWTVNGHDGSISIYKLDASTGKIIWEYQRECVRYDNIAGGVQCSPLLGREGTNIGGLIIYSIGRTPSAYRGVLIALDKDTGEKIWEISSGNYAWSSPVALYTEDGHAYIFLANASGVARLIDGATGEVLSTLDFGQTVEASAVVFGNMLVIGSREAVYGIKIS